MIVFVLLAALAIAGALGTILFKNGIYSALSLVGTLLTVAMIYVTLEAQFLASVQVIVYAGAIMVLFLFVIMLLNAAQAEASVDPIPWVTSFAVVGGLVVAGVLGYAAFQFKAPKPLETAAQVLQGGMPGPIGETLFTKFLLPFEAVSILLLIAVVGAVALVRRDAPETRVLETPFEAATSVHEEMNVVDGRGVRA